MNRDALVPQGDCDRACPGVDPSGNAVDSSLLPVLYVLLMACLNIGLFDGDDFCGNESLVVVRHLARDTDAISYLKIGHWNGSGVAKRFFAGYDPKNLCFRLDRDIDLGAGIRRQRDRRSANSFDGADRLGDSARSRLLRLRVGTER